MSVNQFSELMTQGRILLLKLLPIAGNRFLGRSKKPAAWDGRAMIPGRRFAAHIRLPNREQIAHGAQQRGFNPNGGASKARSRSAPASDSARSAAVGHYPRAPKRRGKRAARSQHTG